MHRALSLFAVLLVWGTAHCSTAGRRARRSSTTGTECGPERKTYSSEQFQVLKSMQHDWKADTSTQALTDKQSAWFAEISRQDVDPTTTYQAGSNRTTGAELRMPEVWPTGVRKEYRQLTGIERDSFHRAVLAMKRTFPDPTDRTTSEYDIFVKKQGHMEAPGAHFGAAFLPWHREFLWR